MASVDVTAATLEAKFGVDLTTAQRFSRARKGDLKKAELFLSEDLKWREEAKPAEITQADIPRALPSGCWRCLGLSTEGCPVLLITLLLWNPASYDVPEYGRYCVYFLEHCTRMGERFIVIFDMQDWKLSHALQMRKIKCLLDTLQDHYPERLEAVLIMRAPAIFGAAWSTIKRLLDPVTAAKVRFVDSGPEAEAAAHKAVGSWQVVPTRYGGCNEETVPVPNLPGEPDVAGAPGLLRS